MAALLAATSATKSCWRTSATGTSNRSVVSELLPVPPFRFRNREGPGQSVGDLLRSLGTWTDPKTGETYPIRLESDGRHYSVGLSTGLTLRVPSVAYSQLGAGAFDRIRQVEITACVTDRRCAYSWVCYDERGGYTFAGYDGSGTWTLLSWNEGSRYRGFHS